MKSISIETVVAAPLGLVWEVWTAPHHIQAWNHASPDWECPYAENDLRVGGKFLARMAAKDGSSGFDFGGTYTVVEPPEAIAYQMDGGRMVSVSFAPVPEGVRVVESFDLEDQNSEKLQRAGWQAILNNFTLYTESIYSKGF